MALIHHLAWILITVLRFAGIIIVFAGVLLFGVFFIGGNARSKDGRVAASSWKGSGPKKGMRIIALGAVMLLAAFVVSLSMPN
jgi:hypothetical protein